jgi:hypothetical protein
MNRWSFQSQISKCARESLAGNRLSVEEIDPNPRQDKKNGFLSLQQLDISVCGN